MIEMARIKIMITYRLFCRLTLTCSIHPQDIVQKHSTWKLSSSTYQLLIEHIIYPTVNSLREIRDYNKLICFFIPDLFTSKLH